MKSFCSKKQGLRSVSALFAAIVSFQVGAAIAKTLFPVFGPFGTVGLRLGLSMLLLCAMWRPWRHRLSRRALAAAVPYGLCLGAMNLLFYLALSRLSLGVAVAIEFIGPLTLAFLGSRRRLDLVWAAMVAIGLALLLAPGGSLHGVNLAGVGFAGAAGLGGAAYALFGRRSGRELPSGPATALGTSVASLAIVPFCLPAMAPILQHPSLLVRAAGVGVLSGALPYSLEMIALRRMSARGYGVLSSLDPVLAALSGLLLLGEQLSPLRWLAIGCIVLASIGSTLAGERAMMPA